MPFSIDRTLHDRPLGFVAAFPQAGAAREPLLGWIGVARHAADRPGAAAAAMLPAVPARSPVNGFAAAQLHRSSATLRGVAFVAAGIDAPACGALAARAAAPVGVGFEQIACVPLGPAGTAGDKETPAPWLAAADAPRLGQLPEALRLRGEPVAAATTRGIVEGQLVSIWALATGRLPPRGRGALRITLLTDAWLASATLDQLLHDAVAPVVAQVAGVAAPLADDGLLALASGVAGAATLSPDSLGFDALRVATAALTQALTRDLLARALAPAEARLVQISVVGARDAAQAIAEAEALAAANDLAERLAADRSVRRSKDGRQLALAVDLRCGTGQATRWTAVSSGAGAHERV